ncbi:hypothetical protein EPUS_02788 [Endocarpon pusillum Z07020]|uniref:Major facilitator superfamily (MFS) profile domain-containing protein n=1 Tax=Endocarpon pusillum (strain Z07020 / HMAS-L-300199) TaxID=1263415 RepID=U1FU74_ENDPU|nr:uncharacterized protein EPUS_02788 [Endocarpon pusillum Z07020]ERF68332.1 hypothetical protein EPUS_02788 [Endocarpon pusillum Z07020]
MTDAHPNSIHEQSDHHLASGTDLRTASSSPGHAATSYSGVRDSIELQTLLRKAHEDESCNPITQGGDSSSEASSEASSDAGNDAGYHTGSLSRVASLSKSYTVNEEKAVIRKSDRRLVLFMALLYLLSFLDRSNIGNARIAGLETSLSLRPGQYAWLLTAFYITYISFEWMTLLYRIVPPHIYISLCVLSWGLVASLQSISTSFSSLVIFRALLGVAEAAFGPGVPFYLSFFYRRSELAYRVGLFISAAPLATSCASTLAWLIVKLSQHGPLEPWRALFLIEGFPSIIVAIFAWHIIPDSPATAKYLTARERKVAKLRLQSEEKPTSSSKYTTTATNSNSTQANHLSLPDLLTTLRSPIPYLTSLMFFSANISFSSLPVFLPTILTSLSSHPSPLTSQLLSAPPYLLSFLFVLLISHLSDTIPHSRGVFIITASLLSSLSYLAIGLAGRYHALLGPTATLLIRYGGVFGAAMGFFSAITLIITWTLNNQQSDTGKGTGLAILNVVGQCGPLVGTRLYPESDAPFFVRGMLREREGEGELGSAYTGEDVEMVGLGGGDEEEEADGEETSRHLMGRKGKRRKRKDGKESRGGQSFVYML